MSLPWNRFARLISALLVAAALSVGLACGGDSGLEPAEGLDDANQAGTELVTQYVRLVQDQDSSGLESFLSDAFIIQRADGSSSEKAAYLQNLPEVGEFTISDVTALQSNNTLIVRWFLSVEEVINGRPFSPEPAPRLSTFVYHDGQWRLASHANFNLPEASQDPAGN